MNFAISLKIFGRVVFFLNDSLKTTIILNTGDLSLPCMEKLK